MTAGWDDFYDTSEPAWLDGDPRHCSWPISENRLEPADDSLSAAGTANSWASKAQTYRGRLRSAEHAWYGCAGCKEAGSGVRKSFLSQSSEAPGFLPVPSGVTVADSFHSSLPARGFPLTGDRAGNVDLHWVRKPVMVTSDHTRSTHNAPGSPKH